MDTEDPTPDKLYWYRFAQGRLSLDEAATLVGVCSRTLKRWERGHSPISRAAFHLLKLHAAGIVQTGVWSGWTADTQHLYTPEGTATTSGEIRALPYLIALVDSLRARHR
jgi:hypothetical protein